MNYNLLKSRTFYSLIAMFVVGGGNAILPIIPGTYAGLAEAILMALGAYFHLDAVRTAGSTQAN